MAAGGHRPLSVPRQAELKVTPNQRRLLQPPLAKAGSKPRESRRSIGLSNFQFPAVEQPPVSASASRPRGASSAQLQHPSCSARNPVSQNFSGHRLRPAQSTVNTKRVKRAFSKFSLLGCASQLVREPFLPQFTSAVRSKLLLRAHHHENSHRRNSTETSANRS